MAKDKMSFILYSDVHHTVKKLTDEQAGRLFKHILSYVNDENPVLNDILLEIAFEPIKQSLKRDLRKYENIREKRSIAGKASADKRQQVLTSVEQKQQVLTHSTVSVSDNVSVNDIVSDNVKEKKKKYAPFVLLLESEFNKLTETYGAVNTNKCIEKLNNYKGSTGKRYKSDYLTILNWVAGEVLKENQSVKNNVFAKYGVQ